MSRSVEELGRRVLVAKTVAECYKAAWDEEKHPRGAGGRFADAVGGVVERVGRAIASNAASRVAHAAEAASTKITTARAVVEWARSTPAKEVIQHAAKSRPAKEALTFAVQGLISALTHTQDPHIDDVVAHHVTNMSQTLGIAKAQAAKQLKSTLESLRKLRAKHLSKAEDDKVLVVLDELLAALARYNPGREKNG